MPAARTAAAAVPLLGKPAIGVPRSAGRDCAVVPESHTATDARFRPAARRRVRRSGVRRPARFLRAGRASAAGRVRRPGSRSRAGRAAPAAGARGGPAFGRPLRLRGDGSASPIVGCGTEPSDGAADGDREAGCPPLRLDRRGGHAARDRPVGPDSGATPRAGEAQRVLRKTRARRSPCATAVCPLLLRPDRVCGPLDEGLDLLHLVRGQLAGEVRHALRAVRTLEHVLVGVPRSPAPASSPGS